MDVIEALGAGPVAVDTAAFIYWIEDHPTMAPIVAPIFHGADRGDFTICTSALTLLEVLVVPYRVGNLELAAAYEDLFGNAGGVDMVPIDSDVLREAARIRASSRVRTPDAIQLATAVVRGCSSFVTCDRGFPSLPTMRIVTLGP